MNGRIAFLVFLAGFLWSPPLRAAPYSLNELYELALKKSEQVRISEEEIAAAKARFGTAIGQITPHLSVNFEEFLQDPTETSGGSSFADTFTQLSRPEVALTLRQPLFHGLSELYAIKASRADRAQMNYELEEAKRRLFMDVASVYYTVVGLTQEVKTGQTIVGVLRQQVKEMRRRAELGKSRMASLAQSEAELALEGAKLTGTRKNLQIAYETLSFLSGLPLPIAVGGEAESEKGRQTLDDYLMVAGERKDVLAAKKAHQKSRELLGAQYGGFLPQADVTANYYPYREGFQQEIKWDLIFNVSAPIFDWKNVGKVEEARAEARKAALRAGEKERTALTEVRKSFAACESSKKEHEQYRIAAIKSRQSYNLQLADFANGLVDDMDLLLVQRSWIESVKARDAARIQMLMDHALLKVAAGVWPGD